MSKRTLDLSDPDAVPYFLWNEDTAQRVFREILDNPKDPSRPIYLARLLREAQVEDVWKFVQPEDVAQAWEQVAPHLGRRRKFWEFLLDVWRRKGVL